MSIFKNFFSATKVLNHAYICISLCPGRVNLSTSWMTNKYYSRPLEGFTGLVVIIPIVSCGVVHLIFRCTSFLGSCHKMNYKMDGWRGYKTHISRWAPKHPKSCRWVVLGHHPIHFLFQSNESNLNDCN